MEYLPKSFSLGREGPIPLSKEGSVIRVPLFKNWKKST